MIDFTAPTEPLTDGVVTLRLPSADAGDVESVISYIEDEQLDGGWLPEIPLVSAEQAVRDWSEGWVGRPAGKGPTVLVTVPTESRFIGIVGFADRSNGVVEMIYGIAPRWRGRGLASRAARLGAQWARSLPGMNTVEVRIAQDAKASQHVAVNAGFVVAGTLTQFVPGTAETFEDLRYVLVEPAAALKS
jgi:RimJ/RimL family protein N-acetyltransferase